MYFLSVCIILELVAMHFNSKNYIAKQKNFFHTFNTELYQLASSKENFAGSSRNLDENTYLLLPSKDRKDTLDHFI